MDAGALSRRLFDAFGRRDLDTMIGMMDEDVCYELSNLPTLRGHEAVRAMYESLFDVLGDAQIKLLDLIAQDNKSALIMALPDSDEVGGSVFHEWSDDGLLLRYQSFSHIEVPDPQD